MNKAIADLLTEAREYVEAQRANFGSGKMWQESRPGLLLKLIDDALGSKVAKPKPVKSNGEAKGDMDTRAVAELKGDG